GQAGWMPRHSHAVTVFKERLWLMGGFSEEGHSLNDVWSSSDGGDDLYNDVWLSTNGSAWQLVTGNAPWARRRGFSLLAFQDSLLVIAGHAQKEFEGGTDGFLQSDIWQSKDGADWVEAAALA
ncbi:hypothetical protein GUITHDRAFT_50616, partial [Guillardia theta CCMP2712]